MIEEMPSKNEFEVENPMISNSNIDTKLPSNKTVKFQLNEKDTLTEQSKLLKLSEIYKWSPTTLKIAVFLLYYLVGVIYYHSTEGWNVLDCIYYITVTVTTVGYFVEIRFLFHSLHVMLLMLFRSYICTPCIGYGYFHPTTYKSKWFTVFYILFGVPIVLTITNEFVKIVLTNFFEYCITGYFHYIYKRNTVRMKELQLHKVYLSWIMVFLSILLGAMYYSSNEGWTFEDGIYWATCTVSTVGYEISRKYMAIYIGDVLLHFDSTRAYGIFYLLACTSLFSVAVSNLLDVVYSPYDEDEISPLTSMMVVADQLAGKNSYVQPRSVPTSNTITKDRLVLEILMQVNSESVPIITNIMQQVDQTASNDDYRRTYTKEDITKHVALYKLRTNPQAYTTNPMFLSSDNLERQPNSSNE